MHTAKGTRYGCATGKKHEHPSLELSQPRKEHPISTEYSLNPPPKNPKGNRYPSKPRNKLKKKKKEKEKTVRLSSPRNIQRIRIRKVQRIFSYDNIKNNLSRISNLNIESSTDFLEICVRLSSTNPENDRYVHPPSNAEAPHPLFHGQHDTTTVQIHTNLQH